jgi:hypothetical protein
MDITYQYFEDEALFIEKYSGIFSIEQHVSYTHFISKHVVKQNIQKVIVDFTDISLEQTPYNAPNDFIENMKNMVDFRKNINKNKLKNKNVKLAMWADKDIPKVIAHIFSLNFQEENYNYCPSVEKVVEALKLPEKFLELKEIVKNLDHKYSPEKVPVTNQ